MLHPMSMDRRIAGSTLRGADHPVEQARCDGGRAPALERDSISDMPELPEVETIARELRPLVLGSTIEGFWTDRKSVV